MSSRSQGAKRWADLALVAIAVFTDATQKEIFVREWKADKTVAVRSYPRSVRAGGAAANVTAVVVRRKA